MNMSGDTRPEGEFRAKIALLGPEETFKTAFLRRISRDKLQDSLKEIIGVSMGTLTVDTSLLSPPIHSCLHISIWDIDCSANFSRFRARYYRGSGAVLVFVDEFTLDQGLLYCREIQRHDLAISIGVVILYDAGSPPEIPPHLNNTVFGQFENMDLRKPDDAITWVVEVLGHKYPSNLWQGVGGLLFLPKVALLGDDPPAPHYQEYSPPTGNDDDLMQESPLNSSTLERFLTRSGFPVRDLTTVVTNKFGEFCISLQDGTVQFTPQKCLRCKEGCPQRQVICMIANSKGYSSSPAIAQAEMVVLAKIFALRDGRLPKPVLKLISRKKKCHSYL